MSIPARVRKLVAVPRAVEPGASVEGALRLARVLAREGESFRVRYRGAERMVACDASVDPALVESAIASGARVVLEDGAEPCIVGALATGRSLEIDRSGDVRVALNRFEVTASEALVKTRSAFVSVKDDEVEMFGRRILSRAREAARILARVIQLN